MHPFTCPAFNDLLRTAKEHNAEEQIDCGTSLSKPGLPFPHACYACNPRNKITLILKAANLQSGVSDRQLDCTHRLSRHPRSSTSSGLCCPLAICPSMTCLCRRTTRTWDLMRSARRSSQSCQAPTTSSTLPHQVGALPDRCCTCLHDLS